MKRVWCVNYGYGTVLKDAGQHLWVEFDLLPMEPMWMDLKSVIPAEWMR
jgi:hypothetical protein